MSGRRRSKARARATQAAREGERIRGVAQTRRVFSGRREILPQRSLKVREHSPAGFNWGYLGAGPAQLSLALLLDAGMSEDEALEHYPRFKEQVIALHPDGRDFSFPRAVLDQWVRRARANARAVPGEREHPAPGGPAPGGPAPGAGG